MAHILLIVVAICWASQSCCTSAEKEFAARVGSPTPLHKLLRNSNVTENKNRRILSPRNGDYQPNFIQSLSARNPSNELPNLPSYGDNVAGYNIPNMSNLPMYADPHLLSTVMQQADIANFSYSASIPTSQIDNEPADSIRKPSLAVPETNEINPFQLFPPEFHELLEIPLHVYENGSTYNPHDKFKNKKPIISHGYTNTKVYGIKSKPPVVLRPTSPSHRPTEQEFNSAKPSSSSAASTPTRAPYTEITRNKLDVSRPFLSSRPESKYIRTTRPTTATVSVLADHKRLSTYPSFSSLPEKFGTRLPTRYDQNLQWHQKEEGTYSLVPSTKLPEKVEIFEERDISTFRPSKLDPFIVNHNRRPFISSPPTTYRPIFSSNHFSYESEEKPVLPPVVNTYQHESTRVSEPSFPSTPDFSSFESAIPIKSPKPHLIDFSYNDNNDHFFSEDNFPPIITKFPFPEKFSSSQPFSASEHDDYFSKPFPSTRPPVPTSDIKDSEDYFDAPPLVEEFYYDEPGEETYVSEQPSKDALQELARPHPKPNILPPFRPHLRPFDEFDDGTFIKPVRPQRHKRPYRPVLRKRPSFIESFFGSPAEERYSNHAPFPNRPRFRPLRRMPPRRKTFLESLLSGFSVNRMLGVEDEEVNITTNSVNQNLSHTALEMPDSTSVPSPPPPFKFNQNDPITAMHMNKEHKNNESKIDRNIQQRSMERTLKTPTIIYGRPQYGTGIKAQVIMGDSGIANVGTVFQVGSSSHNSNSENLNADITKVHNKRHSNFIIPQSMAEKMSFFSRGFIVSPPNINELINYETGRAPSYSNSQIFVASPLSKNAIDETLDRETKLSSLQEYQPFADKLDRQQTTTQIPDNITPMRITEYNPYTQNPRIFSREPVSYQEPVVSKMSYDGWKAIGKGTIAQINKSRESVRVPPVISADYRLDPQSMIFSSRMGVPYKKSDELVRYSSHLRVESPGSVIRAYRMDPPSSFR